MARLETGAVHEMVPTPLTLRSLPCRGSAFAPVKASWRRRIGAWSRRSGSAGPSEPSNSLPSSSRASEPPPVHVVARRGGGPERGAARSTQRLRNDPARHISSGTPRTSSPPLRRLAASSTRTTRTSATRTATTRRCHANRLARGRRRRRLHQEPIARWASDLVRPNDTRSRRFDLGALTRPSDAARQDGSARREAHRSTRDHDELDSRQARRTGVIRVIAGRSATGLRSPAYLSA